jgi:hypothetical protein
VWEAGAKFIILGAAKRLSLTGTSYGVDPKTKPAAKSGAADRPGSASTVGGSCVVHLERTS